VTEVELNKSFIDQGKGDDGEMEEGGGSLNGLLNSGLGA